MSYEGPLREMAASFLPVAAEIQAPRGTVAVATDRRREGERLEGPVQLVGHEVLAIRVREGVGRSRP